MEFGCNENWCDFRSEKLCANNEIEMKWTVEPANVRSVVLVNESTFVNPNEYQVQRSIREIVHRWSTRTTNCALTRADHSQWNSALQFLCFLIIFRSFQPRNRHVSKPAYVWRLITQFNGLKALNVHSCVLQVMRNFKSMRTSG